MKAERRTDRDGHRLRLPLGQRRRGGRRRRRPRRRLGGNGRARLPGHRDGLDGGDDRPRQSRAPRPEDAADGRRHADGQLRGEQRAGDPERPAAGQGDRLPGGQARGRRDRGRAGPGDRPLRHPGDGPHRPHPADRDRARRLQSPGQDRPGRDPALRGRPGPAVGRLLRDRLRGGAGGDHRGDRRASSRSRRSASAPARRPPARCSSSTTCSGSPPATWPNSSSATPTSTRRWSTRSSQLRRRGPLAPLPRARPRLQRRAGRAGRVPPLPRPGEPRPPSRPGTGSRCPSGARSERCGLCACPGVQKVRSARVRWAGMPIYEFECEECGERFEELVAAEADARRLPGLRVDADAAADLDRSRRRGASRAGPRSAPANRSGASAKRRARTGSPSRARSGRRGKSPHPPKKKAK